MVESSFKEDIKTMDHINGLPAETKRQLIAIKDEPLLGGEPRRIYNACIKIIVAGLRSDKMQIT